MSNRRRKKSDRTKRKASPLKWVMIIGSSLLLLLFIGLMVIWGGVNSWLKGSGFQTWAKKTSASVMKSEVDFDKFEWKNKQVYIDGFRAKGYEDAGFSKLEMDGVRASYGGIQEKAWQIPDTKINRLNLEFSKDRARGRFETGSEIAVDGDGKSSAPQWVRDFLPKRAEMGEISVDAGNVTAKNAEREEVFALRSVRASIQPDFETAMWEIGGQDGTLQLPNLPPLDLQTFALRWQRENLYLTNLAGNFMNGAHLTGVGEFVFKGGTNIDLDLNFENLDLHEIVIDSGKQSQFSGVLLGNVKVAGNPGTPPGLTQTGTINLKNGLLKEIPVLNTIAAYTKNDKFKRIGLNEAKADFERVGDRILLTNIAIQSDGLSRIEGALLIEGGAIAGEFQLGITPGMLIEIPGAEQKVFTNARDGFRWTPLKITGTPDDIKEDLTARMIAAAGEALIEDLPANVIKKAQESLQNPTSAPKGLIEEGTGEAKRLLDTLIPLLGK